MMYERQDKGSLTLSNEEAVTARGNSAQLSMVPVLVTTQWESLRIDTRTNNSHDMYGAKPFNVTGHVPQVCSESTQARKLSS